MSADSTEEIVMVQVPRVAVTLTLEDILNPLIETSSQLMAAGQTQPEFSAALRPEVTQHLQRFTELVTELRDVVQRINDADPSLLASKPGPPPRA
jgi:hypothetical protein